MTPDSSKKVIRTQGDELRMELSFSGGKFVNTTGGLNYQEIIDDFPNAKTIRIMTYNVSGKSQVDALLDKLKHITPETDVQIVTNIPSRFPQYHPTESGERMRGIASRNVEIYSAKFNPADFSEYFTPYFNFSNHAKIVGTENKVYIGSANFSNESKYNIETGVIIDDKVFIAALYSDFFDAVKSSSEPYFDDDFNILRLLVVNLLTKFKIHNQKILDTLFFYNRRTNKYEFTGEDTSFSDDDLTEFVADLVGFHGLDVRAENTYHESNDEYNQEIGDIAGRIAQIDVDWLIEISSTDDFLYDFVNFDYKGTWSSCLEEYATEAYDEYLEKYVGIAQDDVEERFDEVKAAFEKVSARFLDEIGNIISVLDQVKEVVEKYAPLHINAQIDNT